MKKIFIYILLLFPFSSISYGKCYTESPHPYDSNAGSVASPNIVRLSLEKKYPELKCQYCNDYRRSGYYGGGRYGVTARCNSTSYHLTAADLGKGSTLFSSDGGGSGLGYGETMLSSVGGQGNYIEGISNADLGGIGGSGLGTSTSSINLDMLNSVPINLGEIGDGQMQAVLDMINKTNALFGISTNGNGGNTLISNNISLDILNSVPTNLGEIGDGQMQAVLDMINKTNVLFGISTNGGGNGGDSGRGGGNSLLTNDVCKSNNTFIILLRIIAKNSNGKIKDPCNM